MSTVLVVLWAFLAGLLLGSVVFTGLVVQGERIKTRKDPACRCCREGWPVVWVENGQERMDAQLCREHHDRWWRIHRLEYELLDRAEAEARARAAHKHQWSARGGKGYHCTGCGKAAGAQTWPVAEFWPTGQPKAVSEWPSAALLPPTEHEHQWPELGRGYRGHPTPCPAKSGGNTCLAGSRVA